MILRLYSELITVLVAELKKTGENSLSPFPLFFHDKTFTVI